MFITRFRTIIITIIHTTIIIIIIFIIIIIIAIVAIVAITITITITTISFVVASISPVVVVVLVVIFTRSPSSSHTSAGRTANPWSQRNATMADEEIARFEQCVFAIGAFQLFHHIMVLVVLAGHDKTDEHQINIDEINNR